MLFRVKAPKRIRAIPLTAAMMPAYLWVARATPSRINIKSAIYIRAWPKTIFGPEVQPDHRAEFTVAIMVWPGAMATVRPTARPMATISKATYILGIHLSPDICGSPAASVLNWI